MPSHRHLNPLTNWQKNICEWGGALGILLSLTCLIQHLAVVIPNNVTKPMLPAYFFAIIAFLLLCFQKTIAPILIIISAACSAVIEYLWMTHDSFSLVVMLLFVYHVIILVAVYTEQIPQRLAQKRKAEKEEQDMWAGKI